MQLERAKHVELAGRIHTLRIDGAYHHHHQVQVSGQRHGHESDFFREYEMHLFAENTALS